MIDNKEKFLKDLLESFRFSISEMENLLQSLEIDLSQFHVKLYDIDWDNNNLCILASHKEKFVVFNDIRVYNAFSISRKLWDWNSAIKINVWSFSKEGDCNEQTFRYSKEQIEEIRKAIQNIMK